MRTALVTGAKRHLGLWTVRSLLGEGLRVVLTSRDLADGRNAAARLGANDRLMVDQLDVTSQASVDACVGRLSERSIEVDVLINDAAAPRNAATTLETSVEEFEQMLAVNLVGVYRMIHAFLPGMVARGYGRIVNVSSGSGRFSSRSHRIATAYGISKAGLNSLTQKLAAEVSGDVKVNAVHPGWVANRIATEGLTEDQIVDSIVWLATLPADGPNGLLFMDRKVIDW